MRGVDKTQRNTIISGLIYAVRLLRLLWEFDTLSFYILWTLDSSYMYTIIYHWYSQAIIMINWAIYLKYVCTAWAADLESWTVAIELGLLHRWHLKEALIAYIRR